MLVGTLMIEFLSDPDSGNLEFLLYGGKQGRTELWKMLYENFGVIQDPESRSFADKAMRSLCERYFDRLYQITIDPIYQDGWGTISAADFKSGRGQFINPQVERMQQIRTNQQIRIQSFKSMLPNQTLEGLQNTYNIKFQLLRDSGVNLEIPELDLPATATDLDYESTLYDFARQSYGRIIDDKSLYDEPQSSRSSTQLPLL